MVEGRAPLVLSVYDRDLQYRGLVVRADNVTAIARDNAVGTAVFTLDGDDEITEDLDAPGARCVIEYVPDPEDDPHRRLHHVSGPVTRLDGITGQARTKTYAVTDDWDLLNQIIGRPVPGGDLDDGQGTGAYTVTGPAETVVKDLVAANADTVPLPIVVAPDEGRGETISVSVRMHTLTDRLFPALDFAHVSITVRQVGDELVLDAREPVVHTVPITERSGLVTGTYDLTAPTVTRVVVGGGEVAGVRKYRQVINAAAEAQWGFAGWEYVDAADTTDDAVMDARGWETLHAGGPKTGLQVELSETDEWRYGVAFHLGDEVPIELEGAQVLADRVREVEISWSRTGGLDVTPRIGERTQSPDQMLADAIAQLARAIRTDIAGRT